jgi:hypothetical protein
MLRFGFLALILNTAYSLRPNIQNELADVSITLPLGSSCDFTSQCVAGSYCESGHCRKNSCNQNYECAKGELCQYGKVDGELQKACFPFVIDRDAKCKYYAFFSKK